MVVFSEYIPYLSDQERISFPAADTASPEGVSAVGGNLSPGMLLSAYESGSFPWYESSDFPILWWNPPERFVLPVGSLHIPARVRRYLRKTPFIFTADHSFSEVIHKCRTVERNDQDGTWITPEMEAAYCTLHELGYAHSVEVWEEGSLVGGLYGVSLGSMFFGESMFSLRSGSSTAAVIFLHAFLRLHRFRCIDCQVYTDHLSRFGAAEIDRSLFMKQLEDSLAETGLYGSWKEIWKTAENSGSLRESLKKSS